MKKPALKKLLFQCALVLSFTALAACAPSVPEETLPEPDFSNIDFKASPYKHINNGGVTDNAVLPYNIDAITGATVTVEGPAVVMSIPLSMREIENRSDGLCRSVYEDETGSFIYEGLDLYYLLHEMAEGDNGIQLTGKAYGVELKNSNRATIARFTLGDVEKAHADGRPILLAYAHIRAPYDAHASAAVRLYGEGLEREATYTASDIESKQTTVKTLDYCVSDNTGTLTQRRYRGISIYELLIETGVKSNAGDVTVHAADGTSVSFSLSQMKKQNYVNYAAPEKAALFAMLAYGVGAADGDTMDGLPLVPTDSDAGFDATAFGCLVDWV